MQKLKYFLLSFVLIMGFVAPVAKAGEGDWEVFKYRGGKSVLRLKNTPTINVELYSDGNEPKILSAKPHDKFAHIEIITYNAGEFGTSQIIRRTHAVIYNTRTKAILGEFPLKLEALNGKDQPKQPKWTVRGRTILVDDPETEVQSKISVD